MPDETSSGRRDRNAAFAAFYESCHDDVYTTLALTLRDPDLAAECVQEAMARAWERWDSIDPDRNPAGWLYRVALNVARSRWRRLRREVLGLVRDRPAPTQHPAGLDVDLDRALAALPVGQRAVVVLRTLMRWPVDDVAAALGVASGTVKSRHHRALEHLRTHLEEESRGPRHAPARRAD